MKDKTLATIFSRLDTGKSSMQSTSLATSSHALSPLVKNLEQLTPYALNGVAVNEHSIRCDQKDVINSSNRDIMKRAVSDVSKIYASN